MHVLVWCLHYAGAQTWHQEVMRGRGAEYISRIEKKNTADQFMHARERAKCRSVIIVHALHTIGPSTVVTNYNQNRVSCLYGVHVGGWGGMCVAPHYNRLSGEKQSFQPGLVLRIQEGHFCTKLVLPSRAIVCFTMIATLKKNECSK